MGTFYNSPCTLLRRPMSPPAVTFQPMLSVSKSSCPGHQHPICAWLGHLLAARGLTSSLFLGLLLASPTPSLAQCGCRDLHLAMTGNRQYEYRSYQVGESDTTLHGLFRAQPQPRSSTHSLQRPSRPHAYLRLPQFSNQGFGVEVTDVKTQQHMWLTFTYPPSDALTYAFLLDFAAGRHYQVALEQPGPPAGFELTEVGPLDDRNTHWLLLRKK